MLAEHFGRVDRERGIQEDRRGRNLAALHQVDEVDDQLLGPLDRESGDQQGAPGGCRIADLAREMLPTLLGCRDGANTVAIGRLADDVVQVHRGLRIGLEQLCFRPDVAGEQYA